MLSNLGGILRAAGPVLLPGIGMQSRTVDVAAAGSYTPNLNLAAGHNVNASGDVTINDPVNFAAGVISGFSPMFILHIRNVSGGVIAVTFGSSYRQAAYVAPGNGDGTIQIWHWDGGNALWYCSARQTVAN